MDGFHLCDLVFCSYWGTVRLWHERSSVHGADDSSSRKFATGRSWIAPEASAPARRIFAVSAALDREDKKFTAHSASQPVTARCASGPQDGPAPYYLLLKPKPRHLYDLTQALGLSFSALRRGATLAAEGLFCPGVVWPGSSTPTGRARPAAVPPPVRR
jgi:hypothetical protein